MRTFERRPRYGLQPQLAAGDLPIFTEALIHGSISASTFACWRGSWAAARERRALLYKYPTSGHSTWAKQGYRMKRLRQVRAHRAALTEPPSIGGCKSSVQR